MQEAPWFYDQFTIEFLAQARPVAGRAAAAQRSTHMTPEENELLSRTGAGTPMGELLRRYWLPALLSREVERDGAPLRVRLLGEDLIAFRDTEGRVGLLREHCSHRGASLYFGKNERVRPALLVSRLEIRRRRQLHRSCRTSRRRASSRRRSSTRPIPASSANGVVMAYLGPPRQEAAAARARMAERAGGSRLYLQALSGLPLAAGPRGRHRFEPSRLPARHRGDEEGDRARHVGLGGYRRARHASEVRDRAQARAASCRARGAMPTRSTITGASAPG